MIGMEEAPENGKVSSNSAQANGMNEMKVLCRYRSHCLGLRQGLEMSDIWVLRKIFGAKKEVEKSGFSNFMVMSAFLCTDYQIVLL